MKYIILGLFLPLILAGCLKKPVDNDKGPIDVININEEVSNEETPEIDNSKPGSVSQVEYNLEEIAKHNNKSDCWLLINDKVYDVTDYIAGAKHPGGAAILEGCGKANGTELFATRPMGSGTPHSEKAYGYLENFFIADLQK